VSAPAGSAAGAPAPLAAPPAAPERAASLRADVGLTAAALVLAAASKTVYSLALARWTSPAALGDATTVIAVGTIAGLVTAAGTGPAATKSIAAALARGRLDEAGAVAETLTRGSAAALAAVAAAALAAGAIGAVDAWLVVNIALFTVVYGCYQWVRAVLYGLGEVPRYLRAEVIANAALVASIPLALASRTLLVAPFVVGAGVFLLVTRGAVARRLPRMGARPRPAAGRRPGEPAAYAAMTYVGTLASLAAIHLGVVVARAGVDRRAAGLYAAALALTLPVLLLPRAAATALLPRVAAAAARGRHAAGRDLERLTLLSAAGAGLVLAVGVPAAAPLLRHLAGAEYAGAAPALQVLLATTFFLATSVPAVNALSATTLADLRVPMLASCAGLAVTGVAWAAALAAGEGVTGIAVGVLAGSAVKSGWPLVVVARRHALPVTALALGAAGAGAVGALSVADPGGAAVAATAAAAGTGVVVLCGRRWRALARGRA
jgi:O-antigen/teichoic acid export membrane protein